MYRLGKIFLIIFLCHNFAWAEKKKTNLPKLDQFSLLITNSLTYLQNDKNPKQIIELEGNNQIPKLLKVFTPKEAENFKIITYESGIYGTSQPIHQVRAVIFDTEAQKFLGDFPYKEFSNKKPYKYGPIWTFKKDRLIIKDRSLEKKYTLPFKAGP